MNFEQARFNMIEQQIRPWDVLDTSVLGLLAVVKREDFVPAAYRNVAFTDVELPLAHGRRMLPPRVEARWMQELQIERHEKVLEIGTGAGYMAALLGHKAQQVFSVEQDAQLVVAARDALRRNGVLNVTVVEGDGAKGLPSLLAAYRDAGISRVTHRFYDGARHELLNETNRDEVTADTLAWMRGVLG